jgi:hypothetical protein
MKIFLIVIFIVGVSFCTYILIPLPSPEISITDDGFYQIKVKKYVDMSQIIFFRTDSKEEIWRLNPTPGYKSERIIFRLGEVPEGMYGSKLKQIPSSENINVAVYFFNSRWNPSSKSIVYLDDFVF